MISQTALWICWLAAIQRVSGFISLDAPVVNSRQSTYKQEVLFHRVLTLRGGDIKEAESHSGTTTSKTSRQLVGVSSWIIAGAQTYSKYLETNPIATKSLTACLIFAASDNLAQRIEGKTAAEREWKRTVASALIGLLYFGPAAHFWYQNIFRLFPGTSLVSILQKAVMGQLFFGPSFTCIFFASALIQSGEFSLGNWYRKIKSDLAGAWIAGAGFWPLVDLISYSLVPIRFIPLFINACSLVWNIYLSTIANRKAKTSTA